MKFKGTGSVWNPGRNKILVNFNKTEIFETKDKAEIDLLLRCKSVQCVDAAQGGIIEGIPDVSGEIIKIEKPKMSKPEVMEALDKAGIEYNPRDKKEVLFGLLEG